MGPCCLGGLESGAEPPRGNVNVFVLQSIGSEEVKVLQKSVKIVYSVMTALKLRIMLEHA